MTRHPRTPAALLAARLVGLNLHGPPLAVAIREALGVRAGRSMGRAA